MMYRTFNDKGECIYMCEDQGEVSREEYNNYMMQYANYLYSANPEVYNKANMTPAPTYTVSELKDPIFSGVKIHNTERDKATRKRAIEAFCSPEKLTYAANLDVRYTVTSMSKFTHYKNKVFNFIGNLFKSPITIPMNVANQRRHSFNEARKSKEGIK